MDDDAHAQSLDLPDYGGACVSNVIPGLFGDPPAWFPPVLAHADQVVLFVVDGLGWLQFDTRRSLAPTLSSFQGEWIHTVAPSTTACALTSIATGLSPASHGIVGYRTAVGGEVLNILRWNTREGDARRTYLPEEIQPHEPFLSQRPPIVTRSEFAKSGFTRAHLRSTRQHGYRMISTLLVEVENLLRAGEPFIYVYYEGLDKVAHEYGLGHYYDAELSFVDRIVRDLCALLPTGAALAVTADHGQVEVGADQIALDDSIMPHLAMQSGEGRFRWLHARSGRTSALLETAQAHSNVAWVVTREQVIEDAWLGPNMNAAIARRLGDVALVARDPVSFHDPQDSGPFPLIGRHGSVTPQEMRVPLLAYADS